MMRRNDKGQARVILVWLLFFFMQAPFAPWTAYGRDFILATYNVENLFDLHYDETEYPDYIPEGAAGWNQEMLSARLACTTAVLSDLKADILALQEIESGAVLLLLIQSLKGQGVDYAYSAISKQRHTAVRCALLSRFPIRSVNEIPISGAGTRNILKAVIEIDGRLLTLYVNHWKSKTGPESRRLPYARALSSDMQNLPAAADVVMAGDFNSDYNEYETFENIERLNDTKGITGINHILGTTSGGQMVDESLVRRQPDDQFRYNLWLELPRHQRWSTDFYGRKNSPDSIIISKGLYDETGIAYVDNSFDKFDPQYLFQDDRIYRWQRADRGKGRHLGKGYSDHLPVFARFTTGPFQEAARGASHEDSWKEAAIADLYGMNPGNCALRLRNCIVTYRFGDHAVIKQKNGRAIYVYEAGAGLQLNGIYDLTVMRLSRYHGNMEIHAIAGVAAKGRVDSLAEYCIDAGQLDLADPSLRNEIVCGAAGYYDNGWLYYHPDRKIRLYFADPVPKPQSPGQIRILKARINYHNHPEILIEHKDQVRYEKRQTRLPLPME